MADHHDPELEVTRVAKVSAQDVARSSPRLALETVDEAVEGSALEMVEGTETVAEIVLGRLGVAPKVPRVVVAVSPTVPPVR